MTESDSQRILSVTPTVCRLMHIREPAVCDAPPIDVVVRSADDTLAGRTVERALLFLPDAVGRWMFDEHRGAFDASVIPHAPIVAPLRAVMPSVTPVCFASMFTGATPGDHGIVKYERPVLACDTIFDALLRAGKRPAIVAVDNCSMADIFRQREMDYCIEASDAAVADRAIELLAADTHDVLAVYYCGFDKSCHQTGPRSAESLAKFRDALATFHRLASAADQHWSAHDRLVAFCPDHGAHHDTENIRRAHGLDIPEDMDLNHYFGIAAAG